MRADGFRRQASPFNVSFTETACGEPKLIELAYALEQVAKKGVPSPLFPKSKRPSENEMASNATIANQRMILANQRKILANQKRIQANQKKLDRIVTNQKKLDRILANQKAILAKLS